MNKMRDVHHNLIPAEALRVPDALVSQPKQQAMALLEVVVILAATLVLDYFFFGGTRFRQIEPHPYWVLVLLMSAQYGTRTGLITALAASLVLVLGNVPDRALEQDLHQWFFMLFKLPILWLIASVIIGEISFRHINASMHLNRQLEDYAQRQATLSDSFDEINEIKEKLEIRLAGQSRTIRKTLKAAREMESLEPRQVLERAQNLIASMLEPDKFSIYLLADDQLQLAFEHGWTETDNFVRDFDSESPLFKSVIRERNVLCIADPADEAVLKQQGLLAGPLIMPESGELFGMLKIEQQSFSQLSLNTIKDFNSIREWIGAVYAKSVQPS
ncbi:MAG: GAF domain-containing protein [Gammaproteobacteria bacterium]|nr:GAF domain-containing protein [Gammaproteobacteria bacterium]